MQKRTYLVTGGAGFLGSHLTERLLSMGNKIICLDNEFRGSFRNLNHIKSKKLILKKGDIRKKEDWPHDIKNIDGIFHLGAINGTKYFYLIPNEVLDVNVKGTINALEFARKKDVKYFAFASSPEAYGLPKNFPTGENEPLTVPNLSNPRWSYGASKIIGEVYSSVFSKKYGFKCSIIRYHNTYGPRDQEGHVIPDLIDKILKNKPLIVEGSGNETRSFCYINDSIDGTILIAKKQKLQLDVFNVGNDKETKIRELVKQLLKISGKKRTPIFKPKKNLGTKRRKPDLTKIKKIGFKPKVSLIEGVKRTYEWHTKQS